MSLSADCQNQIKSELYFGGSLGALQEEPEAEVRLTRFNSLEEPAKPAGFLNEQIKTIANSELLNKQQQLGKWPWAGSGKFSNGESQNLNQHYIGETTTTKLDDSHQPFQVVWKDLAFVVNLSAYDKIISKVLRPLSRTFATGSNNSSVRESVDTIEKGGSSTNSEEKLYASGSIDSSRLNDDKRVIFENLNGYFKSSEITAILGPSGAGKTSLLNAICGKPDNYSGSVQLTGGGGKRRMRLSIIPQRDYLIENLTVRENLLYSSKLLNTGQENFDHEENIQRVARMLNLTSCFQSKTANISGGEYKRVSIAQELLRQPDILILDEPTSGLDSLNCKKLIKSLVQLKENSRMGYIKQIAIVMTIHQPDIEVYQMFDHVYCMARHGRVIYDGHPAHTLAVIREQARKLLAGSCAELESRLQPTTTGLIANPANLLIEIASEDLGGQEAIEDLARFQRKQFRSWLEANSGQPTCHAPQSPASCSSKESLELIKDKKPPILVNLSPMTTTSDLFGSRSSTNSLDYQQCKTPEVAAQPTKAANKRNFTRDKRLQAKNDHTGKFWLHSSLLARRAFTATIRDPLMSLVSLVFHLTIPFVMYTVYSARIGTVRGCPAIERELDILGIAHNSTIDKIYQLEDEVHTTFECSTMFFLTTYCFSMCALSIASLAFPMNMHVLLKEVRNGWYNLSSFVLAKTISSFPFEVLFPVASIIMIYLLLGFPDSEYQWRLLGIALVMALVSMISYSQGLLFGAIFMDSLQTSIFMAICSTLPLVVLSGFTARINLMPKLLQILSWFSYYRYSSQSINILRFGFGLCPCNQETNEYLQKQPSTFRDIPSNIKPLFNFYLTGTGREQLLENFDNTSLNKVHGVSYDFLLNTQDRNNTLNGIENEEIDVFQKLAESVSRSFAFGQNLNNCSEVRSEILKKSGTPEDEFLPFLFAGLFAILLAIKLILFLVVKYKIHSKM